MTVSLIVPRVVRVPFTCLSPRVSTLISHYGCVSTNGCAFTMTTCFPLISPWQRTHPHELATQPGIRNQFPDRHEASTHYRIQYPTKHPGKRTLVTPFVHMNMYPVRKYLWP